MRKSYLFLAIIIAFISCEKETDPVSDTNNNPTKDEEQTEEILTMPVSNVTIEELDASLLLHWDLPENSNIQEIKVIYDDHELVLDSKATSVELTDLENFKVYNIEIYTTSIAGDKSEAIAITGTPFMNCDQLNAKLPIVGEYQLINGNDKIIIGENNSYSFISSNKLEEGTISISDDLTVTLDLIEEASTVESDINILNFWVETYNNCFIIQTDTGIYLSFGWFEKIEGEPEKLNGKYTSFQVIEGAFPNYDKKITNELVISENGTWTLKHDKEYSEQNHTDSKTSNYSGIWSDQDIKNGNYLLLSYNNRKFLKTNLQQMYKLIE